jgi:hypothetical protein
MLLAFRQSFSAGSLNSSRKDRPREMLENRALGNPESSYHVQPRIK